MRIGMSPNRKDMVQLGHGPANGVRQKDRSKAKQKKTGYKKRKRA